MVTVRTASTAEPPPDADRFREELNLAFLDAVLARLESLVDAATYLRYAESAPLEEAQQYDHVIAQRQAEMAAAEARSTEIRRTAAAHGIVLPLDQLRERYGLDETELEILTFALAPALDLSFRKRIARFKDNILLDFTDPDLILSLLFSSRVERLHARDYFQRDGRLQRYKLIHLVHPKEVSSEQLLSDEVRLPTRVINFLLGRDTLDRSIADLAELVPPRIPLSQVVLPASVIEDVRQIVEHHALREEGARPADAAPGERGLVIQFGGPPGTGKTMFAGAIATHLGRKLLHVDCSKLAAADAVLFRSLIEEIFHEAGVYGAVLCLDHCEAIFGERNPKLPTIYQQLETFDGLLLLLTHDPKGLDGSLERWVAFSIRFEMPSADLRERIWRQELPPDAPLASDVDFQDLASLFEISGGHIRNAVQLAVKRSFALPAAERRIDQAVLTQAAHAQLRADMDDYSSKSKIGLTFEHLVLPDDEMGQVKQLLDACKNRTFVMNKWGFGKRLTTGKGIVCMFTGEPGTGKTLCAEILASYLGLTLYQVSIPKIMSKYIGDTEKNIAKIFSAARASHSMLLFDEADALFTKRVKVERSVDRFSNMEVNMLLQEIERFEGIVILTTNLERELDKAFQRRINFKIRFPFPDEKQRQRIWETLVPPECPLGDDVEFELLAKAFELAGGHIKNVVLRAAYVAAVKRDPINMEHFRIAAEAECRSAGKLYRDIREFYDDWGYDSDSAGG